MKYSHKIMLDAIIEKAPAELDKIFSMYSQPDGSRGICVTYSRILAEVLEEFGIKASVRAVAIETGNKAMMDFLKNNTKTLAGAFVQVWGQIKDGQNFQHAVCYIDRWKIAIDLSMSTRNMRDIPSVPFWMKVPGDMPPWMVSFMLMNYPLTDYAYQDQPEAVKEAKAAIRKIIVDARNKEQ